MALATRCPHCQTTFRVAHDQLKLRAGLVRCGACKEIFNGVEHLLHPEEMQQALASPKPRPAPPPAEIPQTPPVTGDTLPLPPDAPEEFSPPSMNAPPMAVPAAEHTVPAHVENRSTADAAQPVVDSAPSEDIRPASPEKPAPEPDKDDPLQRMTLMDFTEFGSHDQDDARRADGRRSKHADSYSEDDEDDSENSDTADELSQAIDDLHNKPWRREKARKKRRDAANKREKNEPNFMASARRQQRYGSALRITMGLGSVVLLLALLLQAGFVFRHVIAAKMPEYRPMLTSLCSQLGCQVKLPAQIDKVSIESSELQSLPASPSKFTLVALLRNQAAIDQAWPHLELTLNDMNEKPVARKVFPPRDYLASAQAELDGFPMQSEHQIRISFEMLQLKAAGYRLYLFYP
jgi:predicted Zn finger-like uncharacterized protein